MPESIDFPVNLGPILQNRSDLFANSGNNFLTLPSFITSPKFPFRHVKSNFVRKITVEG